MNQEIVQMNQKIVKKQKSSNEIVQMNQKI